MALIECSECRAQVSSQAAACPKCGNPVTSAVDGKRQLHPREPLVRGEQRLRILPSDRPMAARIRVLADRRDIPDGTGLRSLSFAVFDLSQPRAECSAVVLADHEPLDLRLEGAAGVLLVLVDGEACLLLGQLHPLRINSSELAIDSIAASVRAVPGPLDGAERAWLQEVVESASLRARGVSMDTLGARLALVLIKAGRAWVGHVGDVTVSIAHRAQSYELAALTEDHTLLRDMLSDGRATTETDEQQKLSLDSLLTRHFGGRGNPQPEVKEIALSDGDLLVLAPRSFVRQVFEQVPLGQEIRAGDKAAWLRFWLDEGARRSARSPVLMLIEMI